MVRQLSLDDKIGGMALMYSDLTITTRGLFLPEYKTGKEVQVVAMLQGINELHHTLSNQTVAYVRATKYGFSVEGLSQALVEIASQYHIESFLDSAIEFARSRIPKG